MLKSAEATAGIDSAEQLLYVLKSFADKGFTEISVRNPETFEVVPLRLDRKLLFVAIAPSTGRRKRCKKTASSAAR